MGFILSERRAAAWRYVARARKVLAWCWIFSKRGLKALLIRTG